MSAPSVAPDQEVGAKSTSRSNPTRFLYTSFAALLVVITFLGFQQFYLHGRAYPAHPIPPPLKAILVTHGALMTAWITLFLIQPLLIATGNRQKHITLGMVGAFIAMGMLVVGLYTPIATTRIEPDITLWGLDRRHFMAIPIFSILTFAGFVAVGVWHRQRPVIHRPMMLLATLSIIAAAADRITGLPDLYAATIWGRLFGPYFVGLVIALAFLVTKTLLTRKFDRPFATGFVVLIAISAATMRIAPTDAWHRVASMLVGS